MAVILFPAIDLYEGQVVRLLKGNFERQTLYGANPLDIAKRFRDEGCTHLHVIDLQGAEAGRPCHLGIAEQIAGLGLFLQYGGGLRDEDAIASCLDAGISRALAGSLLYDAPETPTHLYVRFKEKILPCVDVKSGRVATQGWKSSIETSPADVLKEFRQVGYSLFFVTAVNRDGMLSGPDLDLYRPLVPDYRVVAAGGIASIDDLANLRDLGLEAAVIGKALYEKRFSLRQAFEALDV